MPAITSPHWRMISVDRLMCVRPAQPSTLAPTRCSRTMSFSTVTSMAVRTWPPEGEKYAIDESIPMSRRPIGCDGLAEEEHRRLFVGSARVGGARGDRKYGSCHQLQRQRCRQ